MASKKKSPARPARPRRRRARATKAQSSSPQLGTFKRGRATRTHDPCPYKQTKQERNFLVVMTDIQRVLALARDKLHEARDYAMGIKNGVILTTKDADELVNGNTTALIDTLAALTSAVEYLAFVRD